MEKFREIGILNPLRHKHQYIVLHLIEERGFAESRRPGIEAMQALACERSGRCLSRKYVSGEKQTALPFLSERNWTTLGETPMTRCCLLHNSDVHCTATPVPR